MNYRTDGYSISADRLAIPATGLREVAGYVTGMNNGEGGKAEQTASREAGADGPFDSAYLVSE